MDFGRNVRVGSEEIDDAVKKRVFETAKARGLAVGDDLLDFMRRAVVHYEVKERAMDGALVVDHVLVTWEE